MRLPRPAAWLIDDRGVRHELRDRFVLGRSRDVDLPIARGTIARRHLVLQRLPSGAFEAEDLQTTNGTRLNGAPLRVALLRSGDQLELDASIFVFEAEPVPSPAVDREVDRLLSVADVEAALLVWLDAQVEQGDPSGLAGERLPPLLEDAVRGGTLEVERLRGLVRAATLRTASLHATRELLSALLDADCTRFLEVLTVPELDARLGCTRR
ncbi:MAG: FHA domain-containing protein, partial [Myxococcota bacterium]